MNVYMDNAATSKVSELALEAMLPCFGEVYGNPSSIHGMGQKAEALVQTAREQVATLLGAKANEIYFTSGGTEADNWAIYAAASAGAKQNKRHIITSVFEHHAVLHTIQKLEKQGFEVSYLPVHSDGVVRVEDLQAALRSDTALVSIMYANNEIGTVQPIAQLGALCKEQGVLFHSDAVQAVGHLPVDVVADHVDFLSLSAHKFHGPKGVGVLYCRSGAPLSVFIQGGAQERGKRGGTENVAGIVGLAAALQESIANLQQNNRQISALRDRLVQACSKIEKSHHNGKDSPKLPGIVNFCFEGIEGEALLLLLNRAGIAASSGSACTSGSLDPSHVLLALGLPHAIAHGSLRLSLSEYNTEQEVDYVIEKLPPIIERLRDMSPVWEQITKGETNGL